MNKIERGINSTEGRYLLCIPNSQFKRVVLKENLYTAVQQSNVTQDAQLSRW